jgi:4-aminobutyrate aminotransferase
LYNSDGKEYLDFACGIGVTNTGHSHPHIVEAVQKQAAKAVHIQMNSGYHQPGLDLVKRLKPLVPSGLDTFLYVDPLDRQWWCGVM